MSFVAAATSVGATVLGTGAAAGIGSTIVGGALIGAGVGGAYSALTGDGKILDSMLTGAGIGGLAGGVGGALFPGAAGYAAPTTVGATGVTTGELAAASNTPAVAATSNINPATGLSWEATGSGLSGGAGSTATDPSWWSGLSGKEKLGYGLGATTLLGLLGGQQDGVAPQGSKGMIRPYEYTTAQRAPEGGKPYYFEPIEYDQYGRTTKPIDTAERNYFDQKFTALPTYSAANGGQVPPQLNNMPAGGLSAIQGMRDGYSPMTTMDGGIPQFGFGGIISRAVGLAEADNSPPKYSFDPETRKYTQLNGAGNQPDLSYENIRGNLFDGNLIRRLFDQANQPQQQSNHQYSYDASNQTYKKMANGGEIGMANMRQDRAMPDQLRDFTRMQRMGMLEGSLMGDQQAKMFGGKGPEALFMPGGDLQNMNALAMMNKELTEDTELKLMALGYKNKDKSGLANVGAGVTKKIGKDSDVSAYYEQSPDNQYKAYGARYSKRFADGGMTDGNLGGYSDGGQLLKGPGDGVSDSIPASINNRQPARLADGEFVIPARIVSELGNGSTDAGAKRLYEMMDRIQADRKKTVGKGKVAVDSKAKKHLPA